MIASGALGRPASSRVDVLIIALVALLLAAGAFALQGRIDLNLGDEGHLWYVTARTAQGDVPMRDVHSYDPGRYYWGAIWFKILGPGIITLRLSLAAMQALGLLFGLLTLRRVVRQWWMLGVLGVILVAWMFPIFKAFESAIVLAFMWLAVRLLEEPTPIRHLVAGIGVGLAAFVRIDHGLYGTGAFCLVIVFLIARRRAPAVRSLGMWVVGVLVGYAPILAMLLIVPGFRHGFEVYIADIVRTAVWSGNTGIAKPVQWPWSVPDGMPFFDQLRWVAFGVPLVMVLAFPLLAALAVLRARNDGGASRHLVLAAGCVGLFYIHYTFSRTDAEHLAPSLHPLIIGWSGLCATLHPRLRRLGASVLVPLMVVLSALSIATVSPAYLWATERQDPYVRTRVAGDLLWVRASDASAFDIVRRTVDRTLGPGERILVLPLSPGLYAVLERESPLWDIYFVYPDPAPEDRQRRMIADIERRNVTLVFVTDVTLDGRADLQFSATHPLVVRYLMEHFAPVPVSGLPSWNHLLQRKPGDTARAS